MNPVTTPLKFKKEEISTTLLDIPHPPGYRYCSRWSEYVVSHIITLIEANPKSGTQIITNGFTNDDLVLFLGSELLSASYLYGYIKNEFHYQLKEQLSTIGVQLCSIDWEYGTIEFTHH